MKYFGKAVVRSRFLILIIAALLLVPSVIGYLNTRINYDVLTYLPKDIETMKGQDILLDEFGQGAISMMVVEGMDFKDVSKLKAEIGEVPHVHDVVWYDSFASLNMPVEMLPQDVRDAFIRGDATLMAITYDTGTSADETMEARIPGIWPTQRNRFTFFWQFFWLSLSSVLRWTHSLHRSSFFCRSECASSTISDRMCFSGRSLISRRRWQRSCSLA